MAEIPSVAPQLQSPSCWCLTSESFRLARTVHAVPKTQTYLFKHWAQQFWERKQSIVLLYKYSPWFQVTGVPCTVLRFLSKQHCPVTGHQCLFLTNRWSDIFECSRAKASSSSEANSWHCLWWFGSSHPGTRCILLMLFWLDVKDVMSQSQCEKQMLKKPTRAIINCKHFVFLLVNRANLSGRRWNWNRQLIFKFISHAGFNWTEWEIVWGFVGQKLSVSLGDKPC